MLFKNITRLTAVAALGFAISCSTPETVTEETVKAIDLSNMDSTVNPADDFFLFVNGKWLERTEIPSDQGRWSSFNELSEKNNDIVLNVLENSAKSGKYAEGTDQFKASSFYSIGMDSLLAEKAGIQPLQPSLDKISAISNISDVQNYLVEDQKYGGGSFFGFFIYTDFKSSNEMAVYLSQGGLGLPDRDYYTKEDAKSVEIREKYEMHVARMLQLLGDDEELAKSEASRIMALETRMAEASMTNVERRNAPALYNKYSLEDLGKMVPSIKWDKFLSDLGVTGMDTIIVRQPKFMEEFQKIMDDTSIDDMKEYLRWRAVDGMASY